MPRQRKGSAWTSMSTRPFCRLDSSPPPLYFLPYLTPADIMTAAQSSLRATLFRWAPAFLLRERYSRVTCSERHNLSHRVRLLEEPSAYMSGIAYPCKPAEGTGAYGCLQARAGYMRCQRGWAGQCCLMRCRTDICFREHQLSMQVDSLLRLLRREIGDGVVCGHGCKGSRGCRCSQGERIFSSPTSFMAAKPASNWSRHRKRLSSVPAT